jgi:hypothetical protein
MCIARLPHFTKTSVFAFLAGADGTNVFNNTIGNFHAIVLTKRTVFGGHEFAIEVVATLRFVDGRRKRRQLA